jgi:hypothetical protein
MSWFLELRAKTRDECKQQLVDRTKDNTHTPTSVVAAACALIDALPDSEAHEVYLKTNGHMDAGRHRSDIRIEVYLQPAFDLTDQPTGD